MSEYHLKQQTMKIITKCINPPIPLRKYDWEAYYDNYDEGDPIGYGATEQEAINDLNELTW